MKKVSLLVSLLLTLAMLTGLVGPAMAETDSTPLVAGTSSFSERFSPFFYQTVYDRYILDQVNIEMITLDRMGNIIFNGIEGETTTYGDKEYTYYTPANLYVNYDENADVTTYGITLRDDLMFSDGVPVTADDVIFTYYVYADTDYVGSTTFNSYPIIGLQNYRTQTTDDVYQKYNEMFDAIYEAGVDHAWSDSDAWTQEQQDGLWATLEELWVNDVQALVNFIVNRYGAGYADMLGVTVEEIQASEALQVAFGMVLWGFADTDEETGALTGSITGTTWSMEGDDVPTVYDYYLETYVAYEGDSAAYWDAENDGNASGADVFGTTRGLFIGEWGPQDDSLGDEGIPNISGIKKVDDYTVEVQLTGFDVTAIYSVLGLTIAPMHYYGDADLYDYEDNMFGFPRGDLSIVREVTAKPLGAGPYTYVGYENKVVYLEANELYYGGAPETKYFQWKETPNNEMIAGIQTGTVDQADISGSMDNFAQVASYNSNGEITGDVITTSLVDNRGYGYIGMNADTVRVGGDSFSEESKNLRKGLGTVLAVYREVAYDSYYGEAAAVINYPISNVSWAAPQPTDEGYKVAFSVDVDGNDIYTSDMMPEDKYAIALETAIGFLKAAGYTFDEAAGVFTAAPEGASLSYEITIPGEGTGDHPSFAVVTEAHNAMAAIGIDLKINDLSDTSILWDMINAGTQELWCAAWSNNNPDPDMYQIYYSENIIGRGGTDSNNYHVDIPELDELIMIGRTSDDQAFRKGIYKQAMDIIVDAAVEVPAYQRQNAVIFSTERIDIDTLTPDISTWWDWYKDINGVVMNAEK